MNPDNPYAAPQTISSLAEPLPVAEFQDPLGLRRHYREIDTPALLRLAKISKAIERATLLWLFPLLGTLGTFIGFVMYEKDFPSVISLASLLFLGLCILRLYAGTKRQNGYRLLIIAADAILFTAMFLGGIAGLYAFFNKPEIHFFAVILIGLLCVLPLCSIWKTFHSEELFNGPPYMHQKLVEEADYRRANQIP